MSVTEVVIRQQEVPGDTATIKIGQTILEVRSTGANSFTIDQLDHGSRDHLDEVVRQSNIQQFGDRAPIRKVL